MISGSWTEMSTMCNVCLKCTANIAITIEYWMSTLNSAISSYEPLVDAEEKRNVATTFTYFHFDYCVHKSWVRNYDGLYFVVKCLIWSHLRLHFLKLGRLDPEAPKPSTSTFLTVWSGNRYTNRPVASRKFGESCYSIYTVPRVQTLYSFGLGDWGIQWGSGVLRQQGPETLVRGWGEESVCIQLVPRLT